MKLLHQTDPDVIWDWFPTLSGALAFDIGANNGHLASILARRFDTVVAVEPCEESWRHMLDAGHERVVPLNVAVSSRTGSVDLTVASEAIESGQLVTGDSLAFSWGSRMGTRSVTCVTLDDLAVAYGMPDFVKIDTEGHEVEVVLGGPRTLATEPRLLIEVHARENEARLVDLLPHYEFERVEHPGYPLGHPARAQHFFLRSVA